MNHLSALVVDGSQTYLNFVASGLKELGLSDERIFTVKRFVDGKKMIDDIKPDILITDYSVDGRFGLELINLHTSQSANKISIIVTHNNSSTAIAEAAEELVDDYLVKPFQSGLLRERLRAVIERKLNPTDYLKSIRAGKQMLLEGRMNEAEFAFQSATKIEPKPTLAYYYLGYTKFIENNYQFAISEFKKGLDIQPLHYKCLTGKFDAIFQQKAYQDAYVLASSILDNYPIGPKRLGNLFISAVFSGHLDVVPQYYQLFAKLDHITPELRKVFSAALMAAGRSQILRKDIGKAVDCFELGIQVLGPDVAYIDKVVRALLKTNSQGYTAAARILQRFPNDKVGGREFSSLSFLLNVKQLPPYQVIELGRKLATNELLDAECFQVFIQILIADKKMILAEDMAAKAIKSFPDLRGSLNEMFEAAGNKGHSEGV